MAQDTPPIKVNCPDCSGVISLDVSDTGHLRYVCQIGHAYSIEELAIAKEGQIENAFWSVIGLLEHAEEIYRQLLNTIQPGSEHLASDPFHHRLQQSQRQRQALRKLLEETRPPLLVHSEIDEVGGSR
ncbi:MAG TPA: hypothetical protein VJV04_07085 [Nitrospiraceae bacterium]|nr:hypothetical protein [Nitrospiraceae bacterium]